MLHQLHVYPYPVTDVLTYSHFMVLCHPTEGFLWEVNEMDRPDDKRKGVGIFWWLFLTSIVVVVLPLFLFMLYQINATRAIVINERCKALKDWATLVADKVDESVSRYKESVQSIAEADEIKACLAKQDSAVQDTQVLGHLKELRLAGKYNALFLLDEKGVCAVSTTPELTGRDFSFTPYFSACVKGRGAFYMAVGAANNVRAYFSAPVYNKGVFTGAVVVEVDADDVAEEVSDLDEWGFSRAFFVTDDGIVVLSTDSTLMLKSLVPLSGETKEKLNQTRQFAGTEIGHVDYRALWEKINSGKTDDYIKVRDPASGVDNFVATAQLASNGWHVVVMEDAASIQAYADKQAMNIEYAGLITCLMVVVACFVVSRALALSIRSTSKSFAKMRRGDYRKMSLTPTGPKEMRQMCDEFNLLADKVSSAHGQCELQVLERTKALAEKMEQIEKSEKRQRAIIENSPAGMIIVNRNKEIVEINTAALSLIGRKRGEVIGHICHQFICPAEEGKCPIFDNKETVDHSERVALNWKGEKVPVLKSVVRIEINDEECLLETFVDITERKRAEAALRESEERYRSVVDNVSIGVALISPNMEVLALNRQMRAWFPGAAVSQKPICYKVFNNPPGEDVCSYCPTYKTLQDGQVHESITATPANGQIRNYRVVSSPLTDKDGKIVAAIEMVDDITERKRAEDEIRLARDVAEKASKELAEKVGELEQFNRLTVGREMMMIELKRQINKLCEKYGEKQPYDLSVIRTEQGETEIAHGNTSGMAGSKQK
jgi:PAS domain S-box-containing protein